MIPNRILKNGWLLVVFTGVLHQAAGCSSSNSANNDAGNATGGKAGGGSGGGPASTGGRGGGSGGSVSTGGSTGVAGMSGSGGTQACASLPYTHVSEFGAITDEWGVSLYSTAELIPMPGVGPDGGFSGSIVDIDHNDGSPTPGSLRAIIPFSSTNQTFLYAHMYAGVNMSGAIVSAKIKLDSGLITAPTDVARAYLVMKSTTGYLYAPGPSLALDPTAGWVTLAVSADAPSAGLPSNYTSCDIREIDLVIETGNTGTFTQAVIHVDTISIARPGAIDPDAGSGADASDAGAGPDASGNSSGPDGTDAGSGG
jgi:hypothetical protein